jgi:sugar-specific transcriptional regulator TrmB
MSTEAIEEAIDVLQELGLKEYEAKCFAGLARLDAGTAKQLSEITDVPRTRVYDAIRVLEAQGLVEVQHTSPQQFRAVQLSEAMETLRQRYESRVERLSDALANADPVEEDDDETLQEVWSLSGEDAIANRARNVIEDTTKEAVLVIGDESLLTADLVETVNDLPEDVDVLIGTVSSDLESHVHDSIPRAETFVSGLEWLKPIGDGDDTAIGRLVLVDRTNLLVSTIVPDSGEERAVFGGGFGNGLVVVARRLMAQGLVPGRDPGQEASS